MKKRYPGLLRFFSVGLLSLLFAFCSPQTTQVIIPVEPPENFADTGSHPVPDKWWTVFNDDSLNALVDSALESNFTLKTAWQRLRAAQAIFERESASLFPSLDASGNAEINNRQSEFQQS